jgi:two-component system nitrate/nitrite response regulator NarL
MTQSGEFSSIRLVLYTDEDLVALGAMSVFASLRQFLILPAERDLSALAPFVKEVCPDAILVDLVPEVTLGLLAALRSAAPNARLILWGRSFSEELRYQAREIGIGDFIQRGGSTEAFIKSLLIAVSGNGLSGSPKPAHSRTIPLTKRESQLVTLLTQGMRNKEIAACIGITEGTVRIYLSKLFAKIGARDRFEVAVFGLKNEYCGQASWDGHDGFVTENDEERARPLLKSLVLVEPQRRRGYGGRARVSGE